MYDILCIGLLNFNGRMRSSHECKRVEIMGIEALDEAVEGKAHHSHRSVLDERNGLLLKRCIHFCDTKIWVFRRRA